MTPAAQPRAATQPFLRAFVSPALLCAVGLLAAMVAVLQYSLRAHIPGSLDVGGLTLADRFNGKDAILSGPAGGIVGAVQAAALPGDTKTGFLSRVHNGPDGASKYVLFVPHGYTGEKAYPLILFLHGAGERGDGGSVLGVQRDGRGGAGDVVHGTGTGLAARIDVAGGAHRVPGLHQRLAQVLQGRLVVIGEEDGLHAAFGGERRTLHPGARRLVRR